MRIIRLSITLSRFFNSYTFICYIVSGFITGRTRFIPGFIPCFIVGLIAWFFFGFITGLIFCITSLFCILFFLSLLLLNGDAVYPEAPLNRSFSS